MWKLDLGKVTFKRNPIYFLLLGATTVIILAGSVVLSEAHDKKECNPYLGTGIKEKTDTVNIEVGKEVFRIVPWAQDFVKTDEFLKKEWNHSTLFSLMYFGSKATGRSHIEPPHSGLEHLYVEAVEHLVGYMLTLKDNK